MRTSDYRITLAAVCLLFSAGASAQIDTLSKKYPTASSYDSIRFQSHNVIIAYREGKLGVVTPDGQLALPFIYDDSEPAFSNGYLKVYKNGKEGIINTEGKLIVEPIYQYVSTINNGFFVVKLNDKYGTISQEGKPVIPREYASELIFSDGLAAVELNGKYGFINTNGDLVIPYQYNNPSNFSNGRAIVTLNNETFEIDKQNRRTVAEEAPKTIKEARAKEANAESN